MTSQPENAAEQLLSGFEIIHKAFADGSHTSWQQVGSGLLSAAEAIAWIADRHQAAVELGLAPADQAPAAAAAAPEPAPVAAVEPAAQETAPEPQAAPAAADDLPPGV